MSETLVLLRRTGEDDNLSPNDRYSQALDAFLTTTTSILRREFVSLAQENRIPFVPVDIKQGDQVTRREFPLLKIPGRLEPGESAVLTSAGELHAVMPSSRPGGLDGNSARALLAHEVIQFYPAVMARIQKLKATP